MAGRGPPARKSKKAKGRDTAFVIGRLLETDLNRKDRPTKIFQFFFPWFILITVASISVLLLTMFMNWDTAKHLLDIWIFYTLPPAGKETIIPKAVAGGVPAWIAGPSTTIVDSCVSLFLIWNYDWVKKIPFLGPALEGAEAKGRRKIRKARWFKRTAFFFTTLVVFVPFSGSGGFGGTIFGRMLGMNPYRVLLAVVIGSLIGSTGFAILSETLVDFLEGTPFLDFLNNLNMIQIVVVIISIMILVYAIRNPKKAAEKTTKAVDDAFNYTERAILLAENGRKKVMKGTVDGARKTARAVGGMNREIFDANMDLITRPAEIMGGEGWNLAFSAKLAGKKKVDSAQRKAGKVFDSILDTGEKATNWTVEKVKDITLDGLGQTRSAWNDAGEVIIMGGDRLEKLMKKKRKEDEE